MADVMLNHPAGFSQPTQNHVHSLHFTTEQWQKFWQMQIVASAMEECLNSLKKIVVFEESTASFTTELSTKWFSLSRELIPVREFQLSFSDVEIENDICSCSLHRRSEFE